MQSSSWIAPIAGLTLAAYATGVGAQPPGARSAPANPAAVLAGAPDADWRVLDTNDLLVMDLARGGRVVIQLADGFAPVHAANIRALARARWYDGLVIERVQDDYVVQWGDPDNARPLPPSVVRPAPAEYERALAA